MVTVSGPPSCGKTSVILQLAALLRERGLTAGVVKFDCLSSGDAAILRARGIPTTLGLAGGVCPDHYYICNIASCVAWGHRKGFDVLICESAGLCHRCAPHIRDIPAVCVIDCLAGIETPPKLGPMLRGADFVAVTKGDMVSQAEREVFAYRLRQENPLACVAQVSGLSGQGCDRLLRFILASREVDTLTDQYLRFPMPAAHCSYCVGQTRIGEQYQVGLQKKMEFDNDEREEDTR